MLHVQVHRLLVLLRWNQDFQCTIEKKISNAVRATQLSWNLIVLSLKALSIPLFMMKNIFVWQLKCYTFTSFCNFIHVSISVVSLRIKLLVCFQSFSHSCLLMLTCYSFTHSFIALLIHLANRLSNLSVNEPTTDSFIQRAIQLRAHSSLVLPICLNVQAWVQQSYEPIPDAHRLTGSNAGGECAYSPCFPKVTCFAFASGEFKCGSCPLRYTGNGYHCTEWTSCAEAPCPREVNCTDTKPGRVKCSECPAGYIRDGRRCIFIASGFFIFISSQSKLLVNALLICLAFCSSYVMSNL